MSVWWTAILRHMPWVTVLTSFSETPCDGIKWSMVALKDLYNHGPGQTLPPRGIQDRARCKLSARWHYRALQPRRVEEPLDRYGYGTSGNYCFPHLLQQIRHDKERERVNRWMDRHRELVARMKAEHGGTGA